MPPILEGRGECFWNMNGMPAGSGYAVYCMDCGDGSVCGAVVGYHTHDAGMCEASWCCWGFFREELAP